MKSYARQIVICSRQRISAISCYIPVGRDASSNIEVIGVSMADLQQTV